MTHRSECGLFAGRAERELVQVGLADDDRARLAQPGDDRGVSDGCRGGTADPDVVGVPATSTRSLTEIGNAVQRPRGSGRLRSPLRSCAASARARSRITVMKAFSSRRASMRSRQARARSTGDTRRFDQCGDLGDRSKVRWRRHSVVSAGRRGLRTPMLVASVIGASSRTRDRPRAAPRSSARASRAAASTPAVHAAPHPRTRPQPCSHWSLAIGVMSEGQRAAERYRAR